MVTYRPGFLPWRVVLRGLAICIVPVHVWAMIAVFRAIPSWILSMSLVEMIAVMAYPLDFALLESGIVLFCLIAIAAVLPASLYRNQFVSQTSLIVFIFTAWAVLMQFYGQVWDLWTPRRFLMGLVPVVLLIGVASAVNAGSKIVQKGLDALAERFLVLALVYIALDLFLLVFIISRNIL